MPSLLIIQWGIVGFYAVTYFLLGFLRGGSKSTYFTIVAFITTFLSLYLISFISLNLILSDTYTLTNLLQTLDGYIGGVIPTDVYTYIADPVLAAFAIAVIDLILRIVGFIVIYPMIKGLLSLIIFRPIWRFGIKKALLKKQNEKLNDQAIDEGKKDFKPSKKLKKSLLGRFWGGVMGTTQGLLVAFIVLLPLIIVSGFLTIDRPDTPIAASNNHSQLAIGVPGLEGMGSMLDDYLIQIDEMNRQGLGSFMKQITVSGVPVDRYIFDRIFTTEVKQGETVTPINWINELEGILNIARTLYDGKYLEDGFQLVDINEDKLADIEIVFNYLKKSDLMAYMIPTAAAFGLNNFRDQLPQGITDEMANQTVEQIQAIDWNAEFGHIQAIVDALLTFGSIEEIRAYMADPYLMLDLSPEEGEKLANVIRAIGNMQLFEIVSVAAEYATSLDAVKQQISWIAEEERQAYLQDKLAFIIDNRAFISEEFERLALLIESVYTDEFGDVDLRQLISTSDAEAFIAAQNEEWIDNLLQKIVDLELLIQAIPVGVDYALFTQLGERVDQELAGRIETSLSEISWEDEILNVGDIYKEAVQAGAGILLSNNPNYILFVDQLVTDNMEHVRTIVAKIFEESALVKAALELAAPIIVERFVENTEVRDIVIEALMSDPDSGVVDFNIGQEINTVLDIIEKIYLFTNAEQLTNFGGMTTESKFGVFAGFGSLSISDFNQFKASFENLQLINRIGGSALVYARDVMGVTQIYVPETVKLGEDIGSILGLAYHVAKYTYEQKPLYSTYEDIDFAPLFADDVFRSYLLASELNNHSELILANLAHNAKQFSTNESLSQFLVVPSSLMDASPESSLWHDELGALLGAIFDMAASFEDSSVLKLSYNNVIALRDAPTSMSIELITQFASPVKAEDTFGSLDSSVILRSSIKQAIDTFGSRTESALGGYVVKTPDIALENGMLKQGIFVELINGLAILIDDMNLTWGYETIEELRINLNANGILPAFNNLSDSSLISFGQIRLIKGVISEALLSDEIKLFGVEKLNGAQTFISAPADFLDLDPLLIDSEGVKGEEIGKLLISIRSLQLPDTESLSSFGPQMLNDMIGRNPVGTLDDLGRFFDSGILYTFLDKVFQLDGLNDYVNEMLSTSFDGANITIDLSPHPAILGNVVDNEPLEVGRITKQEFRNMVVSIASIGPLGEIGITTFPKMVDPMETEDTFTTFLSSNYIYTIVGRLFENPGFGDYIGGFLAGAFGDGIDLDMTSPSDAKGTTGVEENIITKVELRRIMIAFKLIGLDEGTDNINEEKILSLKGQNEIAGVDDFDRFIESKYIADKLSIILTSDTIIEMLAAGRFLPEDFVLIPSSYTIIDGRERLTNIEFAKIFGGLKTMGLTGFSGTEDVLDNLLALEASDVLSILESNYLYVFIDLMLKSETSFSIPLNALEASGEYEGMVKKSEITDIFVALSIFNLSSGQTPNPDDITVQQIQDLLNQTNSSIVQSLISQAIIDALGANNVPLDAYESENLLTQQEIDAIVAALAVISGNPDTPISQVASQIDQLTVGQVNDLDLTETGSATIKQMISDAILDTLNPSVIPDGALNPLSTSSKTILLSMNLSDEPVVLTRLTNSELQQIILAVNILANNDPDVLITAIPTDVTVGQAKDLQGLHSLIIRQFMTDQIAGILSAEVTFPQVAYDTTYPSLLSTSELGYLIDALAILVYNNPDNDPDYDVNQEAIVGMDTKLYVGDAVQLKTTESFIIRQLITDKITDILEAEVTFPLVAYDIDHPTMLSKAEIGHMIDALRIFAYHNPTNDPDYDVDQEEILSITPDVTVGKAVELKTTESFIIRQLITNKIEDILQAEITFPTVSYDINHPTMLSKTEIGHMIDALVILAYNNPTNDPAYDVNDEPVSSISPDVTVGKAVALKGTDSFIIRQLITSKIEDILEAEITFPVISYDINHPTLLSKTEIGQMIDALVILAYNNPTNDPTYDVNEEAITSISPDVTVGKAVSLKTNESYIVRQLITDKIEVALASIVAFPDDAYDNLHPTMLSHDEIKEIIDALYVLSNGDEDLPVASISVNVTVGQTLGLKDNESLIINQLVSDKIVESLTGSGNVIPVSAYVDPVLKDILKDSEINAMIDAIEILSGGDEDMLIQNLPTDVTIGQLKALTASSSIIIQRLITDSIVDAVNLTYFPDEAYFNDVPGDQLKVLEIQNMIEALEVLAGSETPGDRDHIAVSLVPTNPTVGQTQDLNNNPSLIINQLISESIVTSLTDSGASIPDDAYADPLTKMTLSDDEMNEMILALIILAKGNLALPVASVSTNVNIGQTQALKVNESVIIRQLISDAIVDSLELKATIPDSAFIDPVLKNRLTNAEINHMIDALDILAKGDDELPVANISTDINIGQLDALTASHSIIMQKLITDSIIDAVTLAKVPSDAYIDQTPGNNIDPDEIGRMVNALRILAYDASDPDADLDEVLIADINFDVTVGQTQSLKINQSVIIKQVISDSIVDMLTPAKIRNTAYINEDPTKRLENNEIGYIIDVLFDLSGGDNDKRVSAITVNESTLGIDILLNFNENSIILNRLISSAIIEGLGANFIPVESFEDSVLKTDLIRPEIDAVLAALDRLGISTSGAGGIGMADLKFADLDFVVAIGTTDLVKYPLGFSPIVAHILSEPMIAAVTDVRSGHDYGVPTTAYRNTYDLHHAEIVGLVDALKLIGGIAPDDETSSVASVTINPNNFNGTMITNLIALDSLIVYRMISKGINESNIDTIPSHVTDALPLARNYDPGLPGTPEIFDIKISEMEHIAESMDIIGITSISGLGSMTLANLTGKNAEDLERLVEATVDPESDANTIIYFLISKTIDPGNNIYDFIDPFNANDYYVYESGDRVRLKRTAIVDFLD